MCGLAGALWRDRRTGDLTSIGQAMAAQIRYRGPDDVGVWHDAEAGILLAHVRLAIVDLSPAGHQPMVSPCGRYLLVFNGEIYNHLALRSEMGRETDWRGHSDTETLLAGFARWGVMATLERAAGMFAFALWDRETGSLTLGRDRLGEKPLYYGWHRGAFLFASELKAFDAWPGFDPELNRDALAVYLRHNAVPAPYSIWQGIAKLPPGTMAVLDAVAAAAGAEPTVTRYWSLSDTIAQAKANPLDLPDSAATDALEKVLTQALQGQMLADVPLGAFLSGGIDSSTVVALMQTLSERPVKTFTIGFDVAGYNEAEHAKAVAQHLGTDHTELYVQAKDALAVIPRLPTLYDEPFADSSQIPTFLVSQLARSHVTVALSGDGGDELFSGYTRYLQGDKLNHMLGRIPRGLQSMVAGSVGALSPALFESLYAACRPLLPASLQVSHPSEKLAKLKSLLDSGGGDGLYRSLVTHWPDPSAVVKGATEPPTWLTGLGTLPEGLCFTERMMVLDTLSYLPDDILTKVDRAAMGVSLETRVPMLDHRVLALAWRLPMAQKVRDGKGKWLLREVLHRHVPRALIERPKMGFGIPVGAWLAGPLREWAEALLAADRLEREGVFHPAPIRALWEAHLAGRGNGHYLLWDILMFQAWQEHRQRVRT